MKFKELREKINKAYEPLRNEYFKNLNNLQEIMKSKNYTDSYKEAKRQEYMKHIKSQRGKTYQAIEQVISELVTAEEKKVNTKEPITDTNKAILTELQRNNKILLAVSKAKGQSYAQLEEMFNASPDDEDIRTVIKGKLQELNTAESKAVIEKIVAHEKDTPINFLNSKAGELRYRKAQPDNVVFLGEMEERNIDTDLGLVQDQRNEYFR